MFLCLIVGYNQNVASNECLKCFCFTSYKYYSRQYVLHKLLFSLHCLLQTCLAVFSIHKPSVLSVQGSHVYFIPSGSYLWFVPLFTEFLPVCVLIMVLDSFITLMDSDSNICLWFGTWTKTLYLDPSDWLHLCCCSCVEKWTSEREQPEKTWIIISPREILDLWFYDTTQYSGIIRR